MSVALQWLSVIHKETDILNVGHFSFCPSLVPFAGLNQAVFFIFYFFNRDCVSV